VKQAAAQGERSAVAYLSEDKQAKASILKKLFTLKNANKQ